MRLASATSAIPRDSTFHVTHPLFDSQSDREFILSYAILLNIRALEPALSTVGNLESLSISSLSPEFSGSSVSGDRSQKPLIMRDRFPPSEFQNGG